MRRHGNGAGAGGLVTLAVGAALLASPACGGQDTSFDHWRAADAATRAAALSLGRRAFDTYVRHRELIDPPPGLPPVFHERVGVFVSAMRHGAPRCCMGTLYPTEADTAREIIANAAAAAGQDRRFPAIRTAELNHLVLIVTIVSQPRPIDMAQLSALNPAREGLAVRCGDRVGVTLSGETGRTDRMLAWAMKRAGARTADRVSLFRIEDVRFVEPTPATRHAPVR